MRPRVFPAEDSVAVLTPSGDTSSFNEAAGIPRGRHVLRPSWRSADPRFNEAAGIPRGRPTRLRAGPIASSASMRPRVFPAEDTSVSLESIISTT